MPPSHFAKIATANQSSGSILLPRRSIKRSQSSTIKGQKQKPSSTKNQETVPGAERTYPPQKTTVPMMHETGWDAIVGSALALAGKKRGGCANRQEGSLMESHHRTGTAQTHDGRESLDCQALEHGTPFTRDEPNSGDTALNYAKYLYSMFDPFLLL